MKIFFTDKKIATVCFKKNKQHILYYSADFKQPTRIQNKFSKN